MKKPSTSKRVLHLAAAAAAVATFGVACGEDDGVNDDPFDQPADDPLAPTDPGGIDPGTTDPMTDPMTTDPMDDPMTTDTLGDGTGDTGG